VEGLPKFGKDSIFSRRLLLCSVAQTDIYLCVEKKNQLDATEWFIALIICSTCFGHLYAHHQELQTILLLLLHMVCNALVAGVRLLEAEQQAMSPG